MFVCYYRDNKEIFELYSKGTKFPALMHGEDVLMHKFVRLEFTKKLCNMWAWSVSPDKKTYIKCISFGFVHLTFSITRLKL